mgnify:FL=1
MFATWDDLMRKQCPYCDQKLIQEPPKALLYIQGSWMHEVCRGKEQRALANAMKLSVLGRAIAEYCYYREQV